MALADYIGRTIDVLAWRGGKGDGSVVLLNQSIADADGTGEICTGVQKLAQRWYVAFHNVTGSVKYAPEEGTDFMRDLRTGRVRTEADLFAAFSLAEQVARERLMAEETDDDPDDERYVRAELVEATVSPGRVFMRVRLHSRAETVEFIEPLEILA